jgi:hypothetical protein
MSSEVSEARSDSLPFWSRARKPGVAVGTMKPRMALSSPTAVSPWRTSLAHTTATSACEPFVIHIFAPSSTNEPSACSRATVIIPDGLLPKSGSVRPKQPITSPRAIRGSHSRFCASEPKA